MMMTLLQGTYALLKVVPSPYPYAMQQPNAWPCAIAVAMSADIRANADKRRAACNGPGRECRVRIRRTASAAARLLIAPCALAWCLWFGLRIIGRRGGPNRDLLPNTPVPLS